MIIMIMWWLMRMFERNWQHSRAWMKRHECNLVSVWIGLCQQQQPSWNSCMYLPYLVTCRKHPFCINLPIAEFSYIHWGFCVMVLGGYLIEKMQPSRLGWRLWSQLCMWCIDGSIHACVYVVCVCQEDSLTYMIKGWLKNRLPMEFGAAEIWCGRGWGWCSYIVFRCCTQLMRNGISCKDRFGAPLFLLHYMYYICLPDSSIPKCRSHHGKQNVCILIIDCACCWPSPSVVQGCTQ
jgi:hypothetical protein